MNQYAFRHFARSVSVHGELVMNEVHGPYLLWTCCLMTVLAPLGVLVPELQAQRIVNPAGLLHVDLPACPAEQHMHSTIAVVRT